MTAAALIYDLVDERTRELVDRRRHSCTLRRRGWLIRRALVVADVVGLAFACCVSEVVLGAGSSSPRHFGRPGEYALFLLSIPAWIVAARVYNLYARDEERTDHSMTDEISGVFHLVTVCTFLLFALSRETGFFDPGFGKLFLLWAVAIASISTCRAIARAYCRTRMEYLQNTLIIGAGDVGQRVARKLLSHPSYGLNLVGFIDSAPKMRSSDLDYLTILGSLDELESMVDLLDVERVIVAFSGESDERLLAAIRQLSSRDVQIDIVPRFFDALHAHIDVHTVEGLPVLSLPAPRLDRSSRWLKRGLDVAGSALGLLLLAPFFAAAAIAIRLDSRGPVFFRQVRMGEGHNTFRIWKFRTMSADAEDRKRHLAHLNKHRDSDPRMFKIDHDPRVTRVGAWLRRYSLDELPQLINVLLGEMSLVGPRPLIREEHRFVEDWATRRLDLRPGVTGLWQVLGRDAIPFEEMVSIDYRYVTSWSVSRDISLLFRTLPAIVHRP